MDGLLVPLGGVVGETSVYDFFLESVLPLVDAGWASSFENTLAPLEQNKMLNFVVITMIEIKYSFKLRALMKINQFLTGPEYEKTTSVYYAYDNVRGNSIQSE